jgi:16S rRNA (guanine527-N7)-methyltransferase
MTAEDFARATNVSRETLARLETYAALLAKFQKTINLVSRDTLGDVWRRHFLDSAQLWPLLPRGARVLLDLGSGAGFPGLALAIMGQGAGTPLAVHLVEADTRKSIFLREAARQTGCPVTVHNVRLEALTPFAVDVITARAFASLTGILEIAAPFPQFPGARPVALLLKGRQAREELTAAAKEWNMDAALIPSVTEPEAGVLRLRDVTRG